MHERTSGFGLLGALSAPVFNAKSLVKTRLSGRLQLNSQFLVAGAGFAVDTQLIRSPSSRAQRSDPWIASSCFVTAFLAASAALLAKTGEENEKTGPDETGSFHFGSGGSLCTLATSPEALAVLDVPLIAV